MKENKKIGKFQIILGILGPIIAIIVGATQVGSFFVKTVPNVTGLTYQEAKSIIINENLLIDNNDVSENAVITKQYPEAGKLVIVKSKIQLEYDDRGDDEGDGEDPTDDNSAFDNAFKEAQLKADSGDYLGAYYDITDLLEDYPDKKELIAKRSEFIGKYKSNLFSEAERIYNESGAEAAIQYLKNTLADYQDEEILEKIQYYEDFLPVNLLEEDTFIGEIDEFLDEYGERTDSLGNKYQYKIDCGDPVKMANYVCYAIDRKYRSLDFDLALNSEYKSSDIITIWIEVYDENKDLIFESEHLGKGSRPIKCQVDITGVNELYIYAWHTGDGFLDYDFALTNGFFASK